MFEKRKSNSSPHPVVIISKASQIEFELDKGLLFLHPFILYVTTYVAYFEALLFRARYATIILLTGRMCLSKENKFGGVGGHNARVKHIAFPTENLVHYVLILPMGNARTTCYK